MLYRVFRALPGGAPEARGGPGYVPRVHQGAGRHDSPARFGALYTARSPVAAVAETIQAFRGRDLSPEDLELADGSHLALATYDDAALEALLDLDEPAAAGAGIEPMVFAQMAAQRTDQGGGGSWGAGGQVLWPHRVEVAPDAPSVDFVPVRLNFRLAQTTSFEPRPGRNELADDDILLQTDQLILLAGDSRSSQNLDRMLEGAGRQEAFGVQ